MRISAVIPTFNRAVLLESLLKDVVKQGFDSIFVLDDGSSDNTESVCKQFDHIKFITGHNVGPTANRNRILGEETGELIFFIDSDMFLETKNIPAILNKIYSDHPKTAILSSFIFNKKHKPAVFYFDKEINPLFHWVQKPFTKKLTGKDIDEPYMELAWVLENAFAIRADIFREVGGFDEAFKKYNEGPDLCKRVLEKGYKVAITNQIKAVHTKTFSAFLPRHIPRYFISSVIWYWKHAFGR